MRVSYTVGVAALAAIGLVGCNKKSNVPAVLEGKWAVIAMEDEGGKHASPQEIGGMSWSVSGNLIIGTNPGGSTGKMSFKLDPDKFPKAIDVTAIDGNRKGETDRGIYSLEDKRLRICFSTQKTDRPTELMASRESWIIELERMDRE
jgi:uncharacterized protein (TIGR03067 family)